MAQANAYGVNDSVRQSSVLIVDDDSIVRMDLRALVSALGHRVVGEAENGGQALSLARSLKPEIVLLDIMLPTLSGLAVARMVHNERLSAVVLITGAADTGLVSEMELTGAMGFLSKPLREMDLRVALTLATARFQERIALEEAVKNLTERMEARKLVGRAKAILMEQHQLSEREAFRRIQSQSLALQKPSHEIARAVITASEVSLQFGAPNIKILKGSEV
ncbi:MAG: response regulator [bacterium]